MNFPGFPTVGLRLAAVMTTAIACIAACDESSAINLTGAAALAKPQASPSGDGGGVVIEYMSQRDFGTGQGPGTKEPDGTVIRVDDAHAAAMEFLKSRELRMGPNENGVIVFVGEAKIAGSPRESSWGDSRASAYEKAMLDAKRQFVQYLAAEVRSEVRRRYEARDPTAAMAEARQAASRPPEELTVTDKVMLLANHELDNFMKQRGVTTPPDDPEARRKFEQELREKAASVCALDEFAKATEVAAQAEISGLQAYRTFESSSEGRDGPSICVIAIYSPKSAQLQLALLGKGPAPTAAPRTPIAAWAEGLGTSVLMYTHGCQPRTNEAGEVVLVAFGQVTPVNPNPDRGAMRANAEKRAQSHARLFLGEYLKSRENDLLALTVKDYADGTSLVRNDSEYSAEVKSVADSLSMGGGLPVHFWDHRDAATGKTTFGGVYVFSVSEALRANKIRDMMEAAGGAAGGRGLRDARAPESGTNKPTVPVGTGKSTGGAGAAGEAP